MENNNEIEIQNTEEISMVDKQNDYNENQIQVLEGLEAVRKRPGMYIGSTGPKGLHHLVYEIVDNAIDEALAGYCTEIEVEILPGDIIRVTDNGRGIPVDIQKQTGRPALREDRESHKHDIFHTSPVPAPARQSLPRSTGSQAPRPGKDGRSPADGRSCNPYPP